MTDRSFKTLLVAAMAFGLLGVSTASAQEDPQDDPLVEIEGQDEAQPLPVPQSDDDPRPPVPVPATPRGGVVEQAGVGGLIAYGRAGVLELGGSAGLTSASGQLMSASINPSIGWFFADNLQLSGILGMSHVSAGDEDATIFSLLLEPSYHLPFNQSVFGFLGLGFGGSHVDTAGNGFAVAPRIGANLMVGRSGILTPSLSYQYTTHDTIEMADGTALLSVSTALSANIGYTVMW